MVDEIDPSHSDPVVAFHLPSLLAQAVESARVWPKLRLVGLVAEEGTPEAALLKAKGTSLTTAPDRSVSALISRKIAKDILIESNPHAREWLFEDGSGTHRRLPIIQSASRGVRTTSAPYDLPDAPP